MWRGRGGWAKAYGFGRTELLPIRTTPEAVGAYLSKYLSKHVEHRLDIDQGARVLSFWGYASKDKVTGETIRGAKRRASTVFAWNSKGRRAWKAEVAQLAADLGVNSIEGIKECLGPKWAYLLMRMIERKQTDETKTEGADAVGSGGASREEEALRGHPATNPGEDLGRSKDRLEGQSERRVYYVPDPRTRPGTGAGARRRNPQGGAARNVGGGTPANREGQASPSRMVTVLRTLTAERIAKRREWDQARERRNAQHSDAPSGPGLRGLGRDAHRASRDGELPEGRRKEAATPLELPFSRLPEGLSDFRDPYNRRNPLQPSTEGAPNQLPSRPQGQNRPLVIHNWAAYSCPPEHE